MEINEIGNAYRPKARSPHKIHRENGFKEIFDTKLSAVDAPALEISVDNKTGVLNHSDKILNLLEHYARQLADPAKTLRDIGPLVETIEKEVSLIQTESGDAISDDKELERFIRELAVTANVAALKFQRGDYL